jgi:hypothetical protein
MKIRELVQYSTVMKRDVDSSSCRLRGMLSAINVALAMTITFQI